MKEHTNEHENARHLMRLRDADDLEVADDDPDVRGWSVVAPGGEKLGEVDDLIVDPEAMKVRYLHFEMSDTDRHVIVPVESAALDEDRKVVSVPAAAVDLMEMPHCPARVTTEFSRDYDEKWQSRWGAGKPQTGYVVRRRT